MRNDKNDLVDFVLRTILLSNDQYGDSAVDASYPPAGFGRDPAETIDARLEYLRFFFAHADELAQTEALLYDEESRQLLRSLILFRILGYRRTRIHMDHARFEQARALSEELRKAPSPLKHSSPGLPPFSHFEIPGNGRTLRVDCLRANVFFTWFVKQYHLHRGDICVAPQARDIVVDAGGCFGDTALAFADEVGEAGHVHSFEILSSHLQIMSHNLDQNPGLTNVTVHACSLGESDTGGSIVSAAPNPGYSVAIESEPVRVRSLDSLIAEGSIPRVDFLKMDIEGSEMAALRGAAECIRRFRPKLAISVYHHWEDYIEIPRYIHGLDLGYRMFLANYTQVDGETILYASCPDREDGQSQTAR